ncbi:MAG: hypothetical protein RJB58_2587, partial [Pseudomonadota bacterium]
FLSGAVKDSIETIARGEQAAQAQVAGKANIVDVVNAVNSAELTLIPWWRCATRSCRPTSPS